MTAEASARPREHGSLIVGNQLVCPRCHTAQNIVSYFVFDRPEEHADELNVVLKCRAKVRQSNGRVDTCRNVFSVADPLPAPLTVIKGAE